MLAAAVQFAPDFGHAYLIRNIQLASALIKRAAGQGAKLIVLPELCTTGFSFMSHSEAALAAEEVPSGKPCRHFQHLADELGVMIVWGMVVRDSVEPEKLYNAQVAVLPTSGPGRGEYITGVPAVYHKVNFWGQDHLWATRGSKRPPVLTFQGKKIGLLICKDVSDKGPDPWQELYDPGDADVVALSTNWGKGAFPASSWVHFVGDNKVSLVVANRYGQERNNDFGAGGICIIRPNKEIITEGLEWNSPCVVMAEV
jgi:N-carbamoylputrescine amidase